MVEFDTSRWSSRPALSVTPKHGEAGVGSGGDEKDEGGRHRNGQSPH